MEHVETVVVGAGVIGLAIARALAQAGREVLVLEAESAFGTQTSSRNSEVIHAGLYYPPGSWKARLCLEGKALLYDYCEARGVAHQRVGKVLVATEPAECPALAACETRARALGVPIERLTADEVRALEPAVRAVAGLWSPSTGIIDSHGLMLALLGDAEAAGAVLALRAPLLAGRPAIQGFALQVGGDDPIELTARTLINAAGLGAQRVARAIEGMPLDQIPPTHYAKGHYFTLMGRSPFRHLVYPMPSQAGLGIHVTLDLAGQCRFGPDVTRWLSEPDLAFESGLQPAFEEAIRRYWPELPADALQPGYTGLRPKICGPGEPAADFLIQGSALHGLPGLVNLFGIESPGLTASPAIAAEVVRMLEADGQAC